MGTVLGYTGLLCVPKELLSAGTIIKNPLSFSLCCLSVFSSYFKVVFWNFFFYIFKVKGWKEATVVPSSWIH